jgi:hypothetical protein
MLNSLLKQYSAVKVYSLVGNNDPNQELVQIFRQIEDTLKKSDWKITPMSVENNSIAMMAFFEMFVRKIGGDMPALLCYYFSSLVAEDNSLPTSKRLDGNRLRAFITFKNMNKWNMIISMAQAPFSGYNGKLTERSFFDILLLSDVYKAWDSDPDSPMLEDLKKQAPKVAAMHPSLSKAQVLTEGELAHKSVFEIIESLVEKV